MGDREMRIQAEGERNISKKREREKQKIESKRSIGRVETQKWDIGNVNRMREGKRDRKIGERLPVGKLFTIEMIKLQQVRYGRYARNYAKDRLGGQIALAN